MSKFIAFRKLHMNYHRDITGFPFSRSMSRGDEHTRSYIELLKSLRKCKYGYGC